MKKWSLFLILAMVSSMLISCSTIKFNSLTTEPSSPPETKSPVEKAAGQPVQEKVEAKEEVTSVEKYNAYIALSNFMTGRLEQVLNDYFEEFGISEQPIIDKNFSFSMLSFSSSQKSALNEYYEYADKNPAYASIDPIIVKLKPALNDLIVVLSDAYEYYEIKGYVDDKFALTKEFHTKIVNANNAYQDIADVYITALDAVAKEHTKVSLKEFQDSGELIRYSALKVLVDAGELSTEISEQGIKADNVLDLDMTKFKVKYDVLVEDLKALIENSQNEVMVKLEGFQSHRLKSYIDTVKEVKVAATNIIERVNKKKKVDDFYLKSSFLTENQDGTPEKFSKKISEAITSYNNMNR